MIVNAIAVQSVVVVVGSRRHMEQATSIWMVINTEKQTTLNQSPMTHSCVEVGKKTQVQN